VYLPTIVRGHVIWHLGYSQDKSAQAFERAYGPFRQAAVQHDPTDEARGSLTDGFESTRISLPRLFPKARLGSCWLHAVIKLPGQLTAISSEVRQRLSHQFATLLFGNRQRKSLRVFALGQKLRRFGGRVRRKAGEANGEWGWQWFQLQILTCGGFSMSGATLHH
jgi:hypothetical protein